MPHELVVNRERTWHVLDTLRDAWRQKLPPFDRIKPVPARLPSNMVPKSKEHALFLFFGLAYMRGRINSYVAFLALARMYEDHPYFFDPEYYNRKSGFGLFSARVTLCETLVKYGLGFAALQTSKFWVFNARKLAQFWQGDPRLLVQCSESYQDLCDFLIAEKKDPDSPFGFYGLRTKMVSMYIYFLARALMINPFDHPGPLDFHHFRLKMATGCAVEEGMGPGSEYSFEELTKVFLEVDMEYCRERGVEALLDVADAIWYKSRTDCVTNQGNSSIEGEYNGRFTEVFARSVHWSKARQKRYLETCGNCQLKDICKWNIPSAKNYASGKISIRRERVTAPQGELF